jgi:hypothetical protein
MKIRLLLSGLAVAGWLAADTISFTRMGLNNDEDPVNVTFLPQFNPSLGTLETISIRISDFQFSGMQIWLNSADTVGFAEYIFRPGMNYAVPDFQQFSGPAFSTVYGPIVEESASVPPHSVGGANYSTSLPGFSQSFEATVSPATPFSEYIGTSAWGMGTVGAIDYGCDGCGHSQSPGMAEVGGDVGHVTLYTLSVDYQFTPVPEPGAGMLVLVAGIAFCGIQAGRRLRYR